jgi:hypothetical protein
MARIATWMFLPVAAVLSNLAACSSTAGPPVSARAAAYFEDAWLCRLPTPAVAAVRVNIGNISRYEIPGLGYDGFFMDCLRRRGWMFDRELDPYVQKMTACRASALIPATLAVARAGVVKLTATRVDEAGFEDCMGRNGNGVTPSLLGPDTKVPGQP